MKERLKEYGYNLVEEKKESNLIKFLKKFASFSSIMLEIIIVLYLIFGRYIDASLVLSLLFINELISFIHEEKANKAVQILEGKITNKSKGIKRRTMEIN
ncbi:cation-transporting P-type ATPase [Candidatus Nanopusillus massiliensis]|uniref:cation-transporting P-type ATPase n=1 Tax=Candidatus Nanopusillus massiliensis TaxID=2897163 RepID=UPI001E31C4A9|nr:cation-transporting P-type ATPase [Candidatus Nanopusillus massiliensis]